MSASEVVVRGTLKPDGSLELMEHPSLPAGPVEVIIRLLPTAEKVEEDFLQYLQRARTELEAVGFVFRTRAAIDADLEELRAGDRRLDDIYNQMNAACRDEQHHEC